MIFIHSRSHYQLSLVMRKSAFCICENKDADQLRSTCAADQRLCFRYMDSTIPLLSKAEISNLKPSSVAVQPGLCRTLLETPKTGFLTTRLNYNSLVGSKAAWVQATIEIDLHVWHILSCQFGYENISRAILTL